MRNFRKILSLLALATSIYATAQQISEKVLEDNHPLIEAFEIHPNTANKMFNDTDKHEQLTEEYGYVIIPRSAYKTILGHDNSLGLIVYHNPGDRYCAIERRCAWCFYKEHKLHAMTPMKRLGGGYQRKFECTHCGAILGCAFANGSTALDHLPNESATTVGQESYMVENIYDDYGILQKLVIKSPGYLLDTIERNLKSNEKNSERKDIHDIAYDTNVTIVGKTVKMPPVKKPYEEENILTTKDIVKYIMKKRQNERNNLSRPINNKNQKRKHYNYHLK